MIIFLKKTRAFLRLLGFLLSALIFIFVVLVGTFFFKKPLETGIKIRQGYARFLLFLMNAKVELRSPLPSREPCFFMANHRSYFDPVAMAPLAPFLPIAKFEVSKWPIMGYAIRISGTIFVKREEKNSRREALAAIGEAVKSGVQALIFCEGTTHDLPQTIDFRPGGFRVAAAEGIPIIPIAIDYARKTDAWIGDDTFVPHFFRIFGERETRVWVAFGEPIFDNDANVLIEKTKRWIDEQLILNHDFQS